MSDVQARAAFELYYRHPERCPDADFTRNWDVEWAIWLAAWNASRDAPAQPAAAHRCNEGCMEKASWGLTYDEAHRTPDQQSACTRNEAGLVQQIPCPRCGGPLYHYPRDHRYTWPICGKCGYDTQLPAGLDQVPWTAPDKSVSVPTTSRR
jgi:hypothetical protein